MRTLGVMSVIAGVVVAAAMVSVGRHFLIVLDVFCLVAKEQDQMKQLQVKFGYNAWQHPSFYISSRALPFLPSTTHQPTYLCHIVATPSCNAFRASITYVLVGLQL